MFSFSEKRNLPDNMPKYSEALHWGKRKSNPVQTNQTHSVLWYVDPRCCCICKCSLLLAEATAASIEDDIDHHNKRHKIHCFLSLHPSAFFSVCSKYVYSIAQAVRWREELPAGFEVPDTTPTVARERLGSEAVE